MSAIVSIASMMFDQECLIAALKANNETFSVNGSDVIVTSQNVFRETAFKLYTSGYQLFTDKYNVTVTNPLWLKKITESYNEAYSQKLDRLAFEEKKKLEEERKKYVSAQEEKIIEKAKKLGFKIEKRVEKDNKIQLVLVKREL